MTLYLKFPGGSPPSDTLRSVAVNQNVSFDSEAIAAAGSRYLGFSNTTKADISDTDLNNIISEIESVTGQSVDGAYEPNEIQNA